MYLAWSPANPVWSELASGAQRRMTDAARLLFIKPCAIDVRSQAWEAQIWARGAQPLASEGAHQNDRLHDLPQTGDGRHPERPVHRRAQSAFPGAAAQVSRAPRSQRLPPNQGGQRRSLRVSWTWLCPFCLGQGGARTSMTMPVLPAPYISNSASSHRTRQPWCRSTLAPRRRATQLQIIITTHFGNQRGGAPFSAAQSPKAASAGRVLRP